MSSSTVQWLWDNNRGKYYTISQHEGCWVYQDGTRVYPQGTSPTSALSVGSLTGLGRGPNPEVPRYVGETSPHTVTGNRPRGNTYSSLSSGSSASAYGYDPAEQLGQLSLAGASSTNTYGAGYGTYNPAVTTNQVSGPYVVPSSASAVGSAAVSSSSTSADVQERLRGWTDRTLVERGITTHRVITGTEGRRERLDPSFKVQRSPREFFQVGKVFKVLWPSLVGNTATGTFITDTTFGEGIHVKIQWFIVIRRSHGFCNCLPIQTYKRRGLGRSGKNVKKCHHCIVYTGRLPPAPLEDEEATEEDEDGNLEEGMLEPIRVMPTDPNAMMDPLSRLNFGKVYTVEYNVKVSDFGDVHSSSITNLERQFLYVWNKAD